MCIGYMQIPYHFIFFHFIFWQCHIACGILVPPGRMEPVPPAVEAQSLNHRIEGKSQYYIVLYKGLGKD